MDSSYRWLAEFAQTWGLVYFVAVFVVVLAYALWPSRQRQFDDEIGAFARPIAVRLHCATVKRHERLDQREPQSQPTAARQIVRAL